jgi:hypothetical protein
MQPRQRRVHGVKDLGALGRIGIRHPRFPDHAAFDVRHDEEGRAHYVFIGAIKDGPGDREALRMKRVDNAVLAVHRMRGGQELARRFSPQHIAPQRRFHEISRV